MPTPSFPFKKSPRVGKELAGSPTPPGEEISAGAGSLGGAEERQGQRRRVFTILTLLSPGTWRPSSAAVPTPSAAESQPPPPARASSASSTSYAAGAPSFCGKGLRRSQLTASAVPSLLSAPLQNVHPEST